MKRRKHRRNRRRVPEKKLGFNSVLIAVIAAVIAGYLTARFIVYPIMGIDFPGLDAVWERYRPSVPEEKAETTESKGDRLYAIQYGSFTTEKGAEKRAQELEDSGTDADIIEDGGYYKVIGETFKDKEEAKKAAEKTDDEDCFVAEINGEEK